MRIMKIALLNWISKKYIQKILIVIKSDIFFNIINDISLIISLISIKFYKKNNKNYYLSLRI